MIIVLLFLIFVILLPCIFVKKYIIFAFVLFYPILPEYFALDLGTSLPLMTVSRMLIIILTLYAIVTKRLSTKIRINMSGEQGKLIRFLILFFAIELIVAIPNLSNSNSLKELFLSFIEKAWVIYLIYILLKSEDDIYNCIKCMSTGAVLVSVSGLIEIICGTNMFYMISTATRDLTMANYTRLGVTRAEASFGHPISFSVYILIVIPFIMFFCDKNIKSAWLRLLLVITALFSTISRASILIFVVFFVLMVLTKNKNLQKQYLTKTLLVFCFLLICFIAIPELFKLVIQIFMSLLNVLGASFELDSFGRNASALSSRLLQIQLIRYTLNRFPLVGGGAGYIYNNDVYIFNGNKNVVATSIDNEYLLTFIDKGLLGVSAKIILYIMILRIAYKVKGKDSLGQAFFYSFAMYFISILAVCELTSAKMLWIVISLFLVYLNHINNIEE